MLLYEELFKSFKTGQYLGHYVELTIGLRPLEVTQPSCWVWRNLDLTRGTSKEESQLIGIHLIVTEHDVNGEFE